MSDVALAAFAALRQQLGQAVIGQPAVIEAPVPEAGYAPEQTGPARPSRLPQPSQRKAIVSSTALAVSWNKEAATVMPSIARGVSP